jgi:hypothetical protein
MIGYGSLGALIFSLYLVYDTQLMLGGKHKYSLRYKDQPSSSPSLFKGFSQDGGRTDFSKNHRAPPFNKCLDRLLINVLIDATFSQIHLAGQ